MTELLLLALGASLVNNFVLTNFLGLCPFVGVSRRFEAAAGMALATLFVLTIASGLSFTLWHWVLQPLGLEYLRTLVFILLIAGVVQFTELMMRATSPVLHQALGIFLPLITTNCAVLGVALLNVDKQHGLLESLVYGAAAGAGFALALLLFAALRERLDTCDVPEAFRGAPIALVTAGLMALAFMGFAGLGTPMNLDAVLVACGIAAGLALAVGAALGWAASRLPPATDRLVERIDAVLPQTQCGQCRYPGCRPYAQAIADGEADIDRCPPGGEATVRALAALLDRAPRPVDPIYGTPKPPAVAWIDEERCIGCARCLPACPVDAIVGAPRYMHTVVAAQCTGCELCLAPCPVDCIELRPVATPETGRWQRAE